MAASCCIKSTSARTLLDGINDPCRATVDVRDVRAIYLSP